MKPVIIFAAIFLLAAFVHKSNGEPGCKTAVSDILKFQMTQISACTKKLGFKGKEKSEKMNCIMKCVLMSTGSLLEDGTLSIETGIKFILSSFPTEVLDKALVASAKCQDLADGKLDPKEEKCKSYEPFVKCLTNFIMNVCVGA